MEAGLEGVVYAVRGKGDLYAGIPLILVFTGLGSADEISIGLELVPRPHLSSVRCLRGEAGVAENIEGPSQAMIPSSNSLERSLCSDTFARDGPLMLDIDIGLRWVVSPVLGIWGLIVSDWPGYRLMRD
jgi:hypothetical protein